MLVMQHSLKLNKINNNKKMKIISIKITKIMCENKIQITGK